MSPDQESIILNFTVFAPLDESTRLAYIHFPGDEHRVLGIRLTKKEFISEKLDVIAQASLMQLTTAQINGDTDWQDIVTKAKNMHDARQRLED